MSMPALIANSAWYLASLPEARRFQQAMADVEGTQRRVLSRILHANADTTYGRRFGFSDLSTAEDYQTRVPLVTYDDLHPEIEQMAEGVPDVLVPGHPISFAPTSGSTAATKLIPYTQALYTEFQMGLAPWIVNMFHTHPALLGGQAYWSISPATWEQRVTSGGIPIGFDDDTAYLHPTIARLLGQAMAVPSLVARLTDMTAFRYVTLAYLLRARALRFISVWNPTFLSLLLDPLEMWAETLVRDLTDGTLTPPAHIPSDVRTQLHACWGPDRRRAREIARALMVPERSQRLAGLWPQLALISCWTSAVAAGSARELACLFPHVPIAGKGLLATEGIISFPLNGLPGFALALRSHFFEFLPQDGGAACMAWQLREGAAYQVVVATGGGLYRYQLGDIVTVVGHAGGCPLLEFTGRTNAVSDYYGEKLHEAHVARVIQDAAQHIGIDIGFSLLAPEGREHAERYTLFLASNAPISANRLAQLGMLLDQGLCENIHYAYCRQLGQLQSSVVCLLPISPVAAQTCLLRNRIARGMRAGESKPTCLDPDTSWRERFTTYNKPYNYRES